MSTKKITKVAIFITTIIIAVLLVSIFCIINDRNKVKIGSISTKNIVSFKISNIANNQKSISDNAERKEIINLINSVKITKKNVPGLVGDGYGVEITYSNDQKFYANFFSDSVAYSNNDGRATLCYIDKDIVNDLRQYYDKN